jgi:hypothetical protein
MPHRTPRTRHWLAALAVSVVTLAFSLAATQAHAGPNLILNPGAEDGDGSISGGELEVIPHWINPNDSSFTVVQYNADNGGPTIASPGPLDRGSNYFSGGPENAESSITQRIDLSFAAALIYQGNVGFTLSGWLGGYASQDDHTLLSASWFDADGAQAGETVTLDTVFAAERNSVTGLAFHTLSGLVPQYATQVMITLDMIRTEGSYNDASADNLSFTLTDGVAPPTITPVPEPSTYALMLAGLAGVGGVVRRRAAASNRAA